MKKLFTGIVVLYFLFGFSIAMSSYIQDLKTFDCVDEQGAHGTGGFFTNPNPDQCIRRGFTLKSILTIPLLTILSVPMVGARL